MLDTSNQLAAYQALFGVGFNPAASVTLANSISSKAKGLVASLLLAVPETTDYPSNIATSVASIRTFITVLNSTELLAQDFAASFGEFESPSELLNVGIGWECYLKGAGQDTHTVPDFAIALADTTVVQGLFDAIKTLSITQIETVMAEINVLLTPPPATGVHGETVSSESSLAPPVPVSNELVNRLATATASLDAAAIMISDRLTDLNHLTVEGQKSISQSKKAFSYAISVSLLDSMQDRVSLAGAVSAITPTAVINAIKGVS